MSKSIFIVGAGPGIGMATAERFGRAGARVFLAARKPEQLNSLLGDLRKQGIEAEAQALDATRPDDLRRVLAQADQRAGGLETLLFNAGIVRQQDLFSMTDEEVVSDLMVNAAAGFHTIRAAADLFGVRGGNILITGGGLAVAPHASYASLGAGKAALRNMVQGLSPELAQRDICLFIGTVATLVAPGSQEARDVADIFYEAVNGRAEGWERVYP